MGAGIVGIGVTELLDRLRRVQQRHRQSGTRIAMPGPALRQFEQRLRVGDGAGVLCAAEEAVRRYFAGGGDGVPPGALLGLKVSQTDVELVLAGGDGGATPPAGFRRIVGTGSIAISRSSLEVPRSQRSQGSVRSFPLPALVTIGRSEDSIVLLNLEGCGALIVEGEPHDAEGLARALALELATSRWSSRLDLVLVGFGVDLERVARVAVTVAAGPLVADLSWRRLRVALRLEDEGFVTVAGARATDRSEAWDPIVVICGPGVPARDVEALVSVAGDGTSGIAVVAVSDGVTDYRSARTLRARGGTSPVLEVLGELLEPQRVSAEEVHLSVELLVSAETVPPESRDPDGDASTPAGPAGAVVDPSSVQPDGTTPDPPDPPPGDAVQAFFSRTPATSARITGALAAATLPVGAETPRSAARPTRPLDAVPRPHEPDWPEVEIGILGPVVIRGADREFTRAWARELVVYLSVHPGGAANEVWATALWPEKVMAPSSLHSTASVARRSLGKARDGSDHLPRSHGRLALGPSVGTDWDRFLSLSARQDVGAWREALDLVRGRPFDGLRSTDWHVLDGTGPAIESTIVDLSGRLAGACLSSGDPRGAEWAARRGLVVSPYDERLYRMLMRAADAAGNPGGVESVMAELVRVVADEIEPVESVHPSTLALYRSLSRRRVTAI